MNVPETVGVPLIVITLADHDADTPAGSPVAVPMPVAPVVVWEIFVSAELMHNTGIEDAALAILTGLTLITPMALKVSQPPVRGMLYTNTPEIRGVPLIVIRLDDHSAETPSGRPTAAPIPVAPLVLWVMLVSVVLTHKVGDELATLTVLAGVTVIVPVAFNIPQSPNNSISYLNIPEIVGVPVIKIVSEDQVTVNPDGKPTTVSIPVAPTVECLITVSKVFTHNVGVEDAALTVFAGVTVIVPVALTLPQPPVKGTV